MTARRRPREIFLSHASANARDAERIVSEMRSHGLRVWYSTTEIVGADDWHDRIGEALRRCDWFVVLLSPASIRSVWVKRELQFALNTRRYQGRIAPVVIRACDPARLSWTLDSFQRVDLTSNRERGLAELLRVWGVRFKRPPTPRRSR